MTSGASRIPLWAALAVATPVLVGIGYGVAAIIAGGGGGGVASEAAGARVARVLSEPLVWRGVLWSLRVSATATLMAAAAAILVAVVFRGRSRGARLGRALSLIPLPLPWIIAALAMLLLLGQGGWLARAAFHLGWIDAPAGMPPLVHDRAGIGATLALAWKAFPFLALTAFSLILREGPALEEAGRTLGATPRQVALRILVPRLARGMVAPILAVFVFVFGSWESLVLLAPSDPLPLPLLIQERFLDIGLSRREDAHVLAILALCIGLGVITIAATLLRERTGAGGASHR